MVHDGQTLYYVFLCALGPVGVNTVKYNFFCYRNMTEHFFKIKIKHIHVKGIRKSSKVWEPTTECHRVKLYYFQTFTTKSVIDLRK